MQGVATPAQPLHCRFCYSSTAFALQVLLFQMQLLQKRSDQCVMGKHNTPSQSKDDRLKSVGGGKD